MRWTEEELAQIEARIKDRKGVLRKKKQPETEIKKAVRQYLTMQGWFIFPVTQGIGSYNGISDFIAIKNGYVAFCEIKTPTGKMSDYQVVFQFNLEDHGGHYHLIRSLDDAIELDKSVKEVL